MNPYTCACEDDDCGGTCITSRRIPPTVSYVPDYSIDAPDGHVWVRPSTDCPNCPCCSLALCERAAGSGSTCWTEGGGNKPGQHRLEECPCRPVAAHVRHLLDR